MKTKKWSECSLWDSDGGAPSSLAEKMNEYRRDKCVSDYWFFDPTNCEYENGDTAGRVWDEYNEEFRWPEDVGPAIDEIDWTGIDAALAAE